MKNICLIHYKKLPQLEKHLLKSKVIAMYVLNINNGYNHVITESIIMRELNICKTLAQDLLPSPKRIPDSFNLNRKQWLRR